MAVLQPQLQEEPLPIHAYGAADQQVPTLQAWLQAPIVLQLPMHTAAQSFHQQL